MISALAENLPGFTAKNSNGSNNGYLWRGGKSIENKYRRTKLTHGTVRILASAIRYQHDQFFSTF